MDKDLEQSYKYDQRLSTVVGFFAVIAVIISCMGLFGLATLAAEKRIKEIGIRKVLGASVGNVVNLLAVDFMKLIILANFIALPVAYYAMNKWLESFAYRTDLEIKTFILGGLLVFATALSTIIFKTIRAALANPVKSIKYE